MGSAHVNFCEDYLLCGEIVQKMLILEKEYGLKPLDDLAVIRIIL
jgi:hypothetical protein